VVFVEKTIAIVGILVLAACQGGQVGSATGPPSLNVVPANYYKYRSYIIAPERTKKSGRRSPPIVVIERERMPTENRPPPAPAKSSDQAPPREPAERSSEIEAARSHKVDQQFDEIKEVIEQAKGTVREYYGTVSKRGRYEDTGR
jgi:hypothetical protein